MEEKRFDIIGIICAIALILILGYSLLALTYKAGVSEGKRGEKIEVAE